MGTFGILKLGEPVLSVLFNFSSAHPFPSIHLQKVFMNSHFRLTPIHQTLRCLYLFLVMTVAQHAFAATQDGALKMEVITAYNLVVDSNVTSALSSDN